MFVWKEKRLTGVYVCGKEVCQFELKSEVKYFWRFVLQLSITPWCLERMATVELIKMGNQEQRTRKDEEP